MRGSTSKGSSMCPRTKPVRSPTDFIDTVWWKSSSACSSSMPKRRRNHAPYGGKLSNTCTPSARRRFRSTATSSPKPARSVAIDSARSAAT